MLQPGGASKPRAASPAWPAALLIKLSEVAFRSNLACPWVSRHWEEWEIILPRAFKAEFAEGSTEEDNGFSKVISRNREKSINSTNRVERQVLHDCMAHHSLTAAMSGLSSCHHPVGDAGGKGAQPAAPGSSTHWFYQLGAAGALHFAGTVVLQTLGVSVQASSGLANIASSSLPLARPEPGLLQQDLGICAGLGSTALSIFFPFPWYPSPIRAPVLKIWCAAGASRQPDPSFMNLQAKDAGRGWHPGGMSLTRL